MKKKLFSLLTIIMLAGLTACGKTDSKEELKKPVPIEEANIGDTVLFGTYEQDNETTNGKEAIEWRVLDKRPDGSFLVISRFVLDGGIYYTKYDYVTWESCTLRSWLNTDFLNEAFSASEQERIVKTKVVNNDNLEMNTSGGNDTEDKVFLLSLEEADKYFKDDKDRLGKVTAYADHNGEIMGEGCSWWLRSPGNFQSYAALVYGDGRIGPIGTAVSFSNEGIRPVIVIRP